MTNTVAMRQIAGRARPEAAASSAPASQKPLKPESKLDAWLRDRYQVPKNVGLKIIVALLGQNRPTFLGAVAEALERPVERHCGAAAVSDDLAAKDARDMAQLGNVHPQCARQIIDALCAHPLAIIGVLNDLFPVPTDWQAEIDRLRQHHDFAGKYHRFLQRSAMSSDEDSGRETCPTSKAEREIAAENEMTVGQVRRAIREFKERSRAATARPAATQLAAPPSIDATAWPTEKWNTSLEKILAKKHGIITFLRNVWEPFIEKTGTVVTRDILAAHDADAEQALTRYLNRHEMPKGISILYPEEVAKIVSTRPELVQAVLQQHRAPTE